MRDGGTDWPDRGLDGPTSPPPCPPPSGDRLIRFDARGGGDGAGACCVAGSRQLIEICQSCGTRRLLVGSDPCSLPVAETIGP